MVELVIKIGSVSADPKSYQDGDILAAFNSRRIRCVHAMHICHPVNAGGGGRAHRDSSHVARDFYELTHQYRFERISRTEAKRINLTTLEEVVFDDRLKIVNGENFATDVPLFIERRLKHSQHAIFGTPGAEIWYGGKKDFSNAKLDLVWNAIEAKTAFREIDFSLWPAGTTDCQVHLFVTCDNFSDDEAENLTASEYNLKDPDNPVLVRKRSRYIDWRSIFTKVSDQRKIEDKTVSFDLRATMMPIARADKVQMRTTI